MALKEWAEVLSNTAGEIELSRDEECGLTAVCISRDSEDFGLLRLAFALDDGMGPEGLDLMLPKVEYAFAHPRLG